MVFSFLGVIVNNIPGVRWGGQKLLPRTEPTKYPTGLYSTCIQKQTVNKLINFIKIQITILTHFGDNTLIGHCSVGVRGQIYSIRDISGGSLIDLVECNIEIERPQNTRSTTFTFLKESG